MLGEPTRRDEQDLNREVKDEVAAAVVVTTMTTIHRHRTIRDLHHDRRNSPPQVQDQAGHRHKPAPRVGARAFGPAQPLGPPPAISQGGVVVGHNQSRHKDGLLREDGSAAEEMIDPARRRLEQAARVRVSLPPDMKALGLVGRVAVRKVSDLRRVWKKGWKADRWPNARWQIISGVKHESIAFHR